MRVKPQIQKYFCFNEVRLALYLTHPVPSEGRFMIATNVGRVAVDASNVASERHESVRPSRVVLTPRSWRRRWQKCKAHRGEREVSRKATAQGMSDVLRCPVCSCACSLVHVAHETAGAARIRHSLRPLSSRANVTCKTSDDQRREIAGSCPLTLPGKCP